MKPQIAIRYRTPRGRIQRPPRGAEELGNGWFTYSAWRFSEGVLRAMIATNIPYRDVKQLPEPTS